MRSPRGIAISIGPFACLRRVYFVMKARKSKDAYTVVISTFSVCPKKSNRYVTANGYFISKSVLSTTLNRLLTFFMVQAPLQVGNAFPFLFFRHIYNRCWLQSAIAKVDLY